MASIYDERYPLAGHRLLHGSAVGSTPALPLTLASGSSAALPRSLLTEVANRYRRRNEWNDRFTHWERSESDAETQRIERARNMVQDALSQNAWLRSEGVTIAPQGSFTNRTNTRLEADIDLRVQHPFLKVEFAPGVNAESAWKEGGYFNRGVSFNDLATQMRVQIAAELTSKFGKDKVSIGKKAIRVNGLNGSRAEVDVVPAFTLHRVTGKTLLAIVKYEGAAILSLDGNWTLNFPDQHIANGRTKRLVTGLQFKRVVRIVKRMRADMEERGILKMKVPSFLIECLVYLVENEYFVVQSDDRYDRVKRVLMRISKIFENPLVTYTATEINGIKPLFDGGQAWTLDTAKSFVDLAIAHLGDA